MLAERSHLNKICNQLLAKLFYLVPPEKRSISLAPLHSSLSSSPLAPRSSLLAPLSSRCNNTKYSIGSDSLSLLLQSRVPVRQLHEALVSFNVQQLFTCTVTVQDKEITSIFLFFKTIFLFPFCFSPFHICLRLV
jgi:hypothetical protein